MSDLIERLAAQDPAEKRLRNALIERGHGIREATAIAARQSGGRPQRRPAAGRSVLAEAVAAEAARQLAARKAARKATKRTAREAEDQALVQRMVAERLALARQFSEASAGSLLREASSQDLAFTAATVMGTRPVAAARPVVELAVDPAGLGLGDLGVAAVAGSSGSSPFYMGQSSGDSPFWRVN